MTHRFFLFCIIVHPSSVETHCQNILLKHIANTGHGEMERSDLSRNSIKPVRDRGQSLRNLKDFVSKLFVGQKGHDRLFSIISLKQYIDIEVSRY